MKDAKDFWDKIAPRYAKTPIKDQESYQRKLEITQKYFQPDWSVLEFGCGTGSTAIIHAPHVKHIIATDLSGKMLEIAEQKAKDAGIENISFRQGTLHKLELETESFDAVLGLNILHLLEDTDGTLSRAHELLKPGGIFVSSTALINETNFLLRLLIPVVQCIGLAPYVKRLDRRTLLSKLTDAGFRIDHEWQPGKDSIFIVAKKQALPVTDISRGLDDLAAAN